MKILNLYAGIGGNRTLWKDVEVTSIEYDSEIANLYKKRFPKDVLFTMDVFDYLRDKNNNLDEFDLIWASPPCQTHSQMQKFNPSKTHRQPIPDMTSIYGLLLWLKRNYKNDYIIENVQSWYKCIMPPSVRIDRHIFWTTFQVHKTTFRKPKYKHGKIGGIMRTKINELLEQYNLTEFKTELKQLSNYKSIVRNCVEPKIGKYILDQFRENKKNRRQTKSLMNFI